MRLRALPRLIVPGAFALAGGVFLAYVYGHDPNGPGLIPACPSRTLLGVYCPGCGSTRALHALLHGELYAALRYNPLMVSFLPLILYLLAAEAARTVLGKELPPVFRSRVWIWTVFALIVVYAVFRNLSAFPFNLLAPTPI